MKRQTFILFCLCCMVFSCRDTVPAVSEAPQSISLFTTKDTSKTDVACYRIPALVASADGSVLAAIDERRPSCRDLRDNRDINIVMRRSIDEGATWSQEIRVVDFPEGQSASDPSFIVDRITGSVFLFYNFMDHDRFPQVYFLHVVRSEDHGLTWSLPRDITSEICKPEWREDFKFITSGRGIQTSDGQLLHCLVNLDHGMHLFGSIDHGNTWHLFDTPVQPGDESKVVQLGNGDWMINSRANKHGLRYVHRSTDQGKSWETWPDSLLIDPGCNASILQHPDGTLLFCNANHLSKRCNLTLKSSRTEGRSWSAGVIVDHGSAAYSSMALLSDHAVGIFYECDEYADNVFVRLQSDFWR